MNARSPAEEEAWRYIVFRLENDPGFWFGLIAGDDRRPRKRLRDRTEAWCAAHGFPFFVHTARQGDLRAVAVELSRDPRAGLHWIVADGQHGLAAEWDAGARAMLMAMNERRDAYRRHLHAGVVVEGRLSLKPILRDFAPDMFSIRAFVVEMGVNQGGSIPVLERPAMYFSVPTQPFDESADALVARAERLAGADDPDTNRLQVQTIMVAIGKLLASRRWSEVCAVADRFLAKDALPDKLGSRPRELVDLFARAAKVAAQIELGGTDSVERLTQARAVLADIDARAGADGSTAPAFLVTLARLAEIRILQRLQRWADLVAPLQKLADLVVATVPTSFYPVPSLALPFLFDTVHRAAQHLRASGKSDEATRIVDVMVDLVERARRSSNDDPRWTLEQARALVLRADDLLLREDLSGVLRVTEQALSLAHDHADTDWDVWLGIRWGAQIDRLLALSQMADWPALVNGARACLDDLASTTAPMHPLTWLKVLPAILLAHAHQQIGVSMDASSAVDEALRTAASALQTTGPEELTRMALALFGRLGMLVVDPLPDWTDLRGIASLSGRLRLAERVLGSAFSRLPTVSLHTALQEVLDVEMALASPFAGRRRGPFITARARARMRRKARALRRWLPGKRLPPFVFQYVKLLRPT